MACASAGPNPRLRPMRRPPGNQRAAQAQCDGRPSRAKPRAAKSALDDDVPTLSQFVKIFPRINFCRLYDKDGKEYTFHTGDTVEVIPEGYSPAKIRSQPQHHMWIAQIIELRERKQSNTSYGETFAKVKWYYSRIDVSEFLDFTHFGLSERIASNHLDVISMTSVNGLCPITSFNLRDIDAGDIWPDTIYCRYNLNARTQRLTTPLHTICLCRDVFNPGTKEQTEVLHYCPRPSCRMWYHRSCLLNAGYHQPLAEVTNREYAVHLLACDPDVDPVKDKDSVPSVDLLKEQVYRAISDATALSSAHSHNTRGQGKNTPWQARAHTRSIAGVQSDLINLFSNGLQDLLRMAQQPIVRLPDGGTGTNSSGKANSTRNQPLSGNLASVVKARRQCYAMLQGEDAGEDPYDGIDAVLPFTPGLGTRQGSKMVPVECPGCSSAI